MKWTGNIIVLIVFFLLCSADGCTENSENAEAIAENKMMESMDSIRQAFEVNFPDIGALRAFEETAKQRLLDFYGHLKIASDSSLDIAFRQKAAEMAGKLFISPETVLKGWNKAYMEPDLITIEQLLERSISTGETFWIQPMNVHVTKPLSLKNDTLFMGSLTFNRQLIYFDEKKSPEILEGILFSDIYLLKRVKYFGTDSLSVWEVFFGEIKMERGNSRSQGPVTDQTGQN